MTWPEPFRRPYSAHGTRAGGPLDPYDPTAVFHLDHDTEMAAIAAQFPEENPNAPQDR